MRRCQKGAQSETSTTSWIPDLYGHSSGGFLIASNMTDFYETWNLSLLSSNEHIKTWSRTQAPVRNLHVLQNSRKRLGGQVESSKDSWCSMSVNISEKLLYDCLSNLEPFTGASGTFMSPTLWKDTWRTIGVLTGFLMSNLCENFQEASLWLSLPSRTISRGVRNLHVLQDSRKRLWGQLESWKGSWCSTEVKILGSMIVSLCHGHASGNSMSSKTFDLIIVSFIKIWHQVPCKYFSYPQSFFLESWEDMEVPDAPGDGPRWER